MNIRQATLEDLPSLKSFDEWDTIDERCIRAGECFVAVDEDAPLAFGLLDRSFFKRRFVAILFVHPGHRRQGLGTALLGHFESIASGEKLWISTNIENLAMQRILDARGYALSGVVNNLGRVPELVYVKLP